MAKREQNFVFAVVYNVRLKETLFFFVSSLFIFLKITHCDFLLCD